MPDGIDLCTRWLVTSISCCLCDTHEPGLTLLVAALWCCAAGCCFHSCALLIFLCFTACVTAGCRSEFDYGPASLGQFIGNLTFPMLGACNIDTSAEPALKGRLKQHVILQQGPFKVGRFVTFLRLEHRSACL